MQRAEIALQRQAGTTMAISRPLIGTQKQRNGSRESRLGGGSGLCWPRHPAPANLLSAGLGALKVGVGATMAGLAAPSCACATPISSL
jgi:hypothetical protein